MHSGIIFGTPWSGISSSRHTAAPIMKRAPRIGPGVGAEAVDIAAEGEGEVDKAMPRAANPGCSIGEIQE